MIFSLTKITPSHRYLHQKNVLTFHQYILSSFFIVYLYSFKNTWGITSSFSKIKSINIISINVTKIYLCFMFTRKICRIFTRFYFSFKELIIIYSFFINFFKTILLKLFLQYFINST